jgi:hypothetical protein
MDGANPEPNRRPHGTKGTMPTPRGNRSSAAVTAAWERFVAGDDAVDGVRPSILLSWYRCRDLHKVDPHLGTAPRARGYTEHSSREDVIFTKLGGAAGAAAGRGDLQQTLISVTDGAGRVLANFGPRGCLRHCDETCLAPGFAWSEPCSGTNGMGTALERPGVATVLGPEHWCAGFHRWNNVGIAIRDPVSQAPLAALNVSRWDADLPDHAGDWVRRTVSLLEAELREHAVLAGRRLAETFSQVEGSVASVLLAVDVAGKVVVANDVARARLGAVCSNPAIDPNARVTSGVPDLPEHVVTAVRRARTNTDWQGVVHLPVSSAGGQIAAELRPVRCDDEPVGMLVVGTENPIGEALGEVGPSPPRSYPPRIPAVREARIVLLAPHEIRYAEANGHEVWLVTDQGRLRAAARGIDNVEHQLNPSIFLRVHRHFIVNVGRIKEVEPGFKGSMTVTTSSTEHEGITVSRRHTARLKRALGLETH